MSAGLFNITGNYVDERSAPMIKDANKRVDFDYYFSAKRMAPYSEYIRMKVYTTVKDGDGNIFNRITNHNGHYLLWKEVIKRRIESHLKDLGCDYDLIKVKLKGFEASREKLVKWHKY